MVTIVLDQVTTIQHGGVTLTGSCPADATLKWWIDSEASTRTNGFTREGTTWKLDIVLPKNTFTISIQAEQNSIASNVVSYAFSTGAKEPEASFEYNEFDALAAVDGIDRIPGETNTNLRKRTLDTHVQIGNASKRGQLSAVERFLDLPHLIPFFFLSARYDHRQDAKYRTPVVTFNNTNCEVQFFSWVQTGELLDLDKFSGLATTIKIIGSEFAETNTPITITNGSKVVPPSAIQMVDDRTIKIDLDRFTVDESKQLIINYPYKERFEYYYYDTILLLNSERTVLELQQWMATLEIITDEYSNPVSAIVWNDGYLEETEEVLTDPLLYDVRESVEHAINVPPTKKYVKIDSNVGDEFYEYINNYPSKGFFKASQVFSSGVRELDEIPVALTGSWPVANAFSDANFQERLRPETTDKNLDYYANILRKFVRMGIRNSIINYDYWGSDSPENIGDHFIPSYLDRDLTPHTILTDEGNIQELTLNERRYYAKKLAIMHR
jgi:hypothetical protein